MAAASVGRPSRLAAVPGGRGHRRLCVARSPPCRAQDVGRPSEVGRALQEAQKEDRRSEEKRRRTEDPAALLSATQAYQKAVGENQMAPEQAVATEVYGLKPGEKLSKKQKEYMGAVVEKLETTGEDIKRKQQEASVAFEQGQLAYEARDWQTALELFAEAMASTTRDTLRGGEILIWTALTYEALGREEDCLAVYLDLEESHPNASIKRQAENLRYILTAPRLDVAEDEKVRIPDLSEMSERNDRRKPRTYRRRPRVAPMATREKTWEEKLMDDWEPMLPYVMRNKYVQVATALLMLGMAVWSISL